MTVISHEMLAFAADGVCLAAILQTLVASMIVRRFTARADRIGSLPPVTLLKPLHGDEPLLEEALASFCAQDYPVLQIIFGVQRNDDPAIAVVERLRERYPLVDLTLVVDSTRHGPNRKVDNLINMLAHAKHEVLVISDADIHAARDLVRSVAAGFDDPRVGLVTTLYAGRPAGPELPRLLGAAQINHAFLPGALFGRTLGREDCLGAVMALSKGTLAAIGGLAALSPHLADDAVLGRKVRALGRRVALARSIPSTSVVERSLRELVSHELRWGRTVRSQAPVGYPMTMLQIPIAWALLAVAASGGSALSVGLFGAVWVARHLLGRDAERLLCGRTLTPFWLAPLRDVLSFAVIVLSYMGGDVVWRGQRLHISATKNLHTERAPKSRPIEGPVWRSAN